MKNFLTILGFANKWKWLHINTQNKNNLGYCKKNNYLVCNFISKCYNRLWLRLLIYRFVG